MYLIIILFLLYAKDPLLSVLYGILGEKNVKVVQKTIEIKGKID